eukprot:1374642-Amorphochlora_amoeboformis.AAC.3
MHYSCSRLEKHSAVPRCLPANTDTPRKSPICKGGSLIARNRYYERRRVLAQVEIFARGAG